MFTSSIKIKKNTNPSKKASGFTTGIFVKGPKSFFSKTSTGTRGSAGGEKEPCKKRFNQQWIKAYDGVFTQEFIDSGGENKDNRGIRFIDEKNNEILWNCDGDIGKLILNDLEPPKAPIIDDYDVDWNDVPVTLINGLAEAQFPDSIAQQFTSRLQIIYAEAESDNSERAGGISVTDSNTIKIKSIVGNSHRVNPSFPPTTSKTLKLIFHTHQASSIGGTGMQWYCPSQVDLDTSNTKIVPKEGQPEQAIMNIVLNPSYIIFYRGTQLAVYDYNGNKVGNEMFMAMASPRENGTIGEYRRLQNKGTTAINDGDRVGAFLKNGQVETLIRYVTAGSIIGGGESGVGDDDNGDNKNTTEIFLVDDDGNSYPLSRVSILHQNFTTADGVKRLPKPFEVDAGGNILSQGAKVRISFLNNDRMRPVVDGCIEELGAQHYYEPQMSSRADTFGESIGDTLITKNYRYSNLVTADGQWIMELEKFAKDSPAIFHLLLHNTDSIMRILSGQEAEFGNTYNSIQFIGDDIWIGNNPTKYNQKAKNVGIHGEKIWLGSSPYNLDTIKLDRELNSLSAIAGFTDVLLNRATNGGPFVQPSINGSTLVYLLKRAIEIWRDTKYTGPSGINLVSQDDKAKMTTEVYNKLPKTLSDTVIIVNRKEDGLDNAD